MWAGNEQGPIEREEKVVIVISLHSTSSVAIILFFLPHIHSILYLSLFKIFFYILATSYNLSFYLLITITIIIVIKILLHYDKISYNLFLCLVGSIKQWWLQWTNPSEHCLLQVKNIPHRFRKEHSSSVLSADL